MRESPHEIKLQHLNLLTKLGKMKKTVYRRLSIKDFDAVLLKKLTREGRVIISYQQEIDKDAYKREVLDYVQTIREFASEKWQKEIDGLWQAIVDASCFEECLKMKNGMQAGSMNRYSVTNIVCRLLNAGVYRQDVSMLSLHLKLEGIEKKNKYYKSAGNYDLNREAKAFMRKLLQKV